MSATVVCTLCLHRQEYEDAEAGTYVRFDCRKCRAVSSDVVHVARKREKATAKPVETKKVKAG